MGMDPDSIKNLRGIPAFVEYSRAKMATDAEFWRREAAGTGIMAAVAAGIVAIGGDAV